MKKHWPELSYPPYLSSFPARIRIGIILSVIPEGTAPNGIDHNEENEDDDVDGGDLLPVVLEVGKHPCLARLAIVAERGLIVRPGVAVRIISGVKPDGFNPHCLNLVGEVTCCRRFAASGLVPYGLYK